MIIITKPEEAVMYGPLPDFSYRARMDRNLKKMAELVEQGYEIEWGATKNWCTINGRSFNVPKRVWLLRKNEFLTN